VQNLEISESTVVKKYSALAENINLNPALQILPKSSYQVEISIGNKSISEIP